MELKFFGILNFLMWVTILNYGFTPLRFKDLNVKKKIDKGYKYYNRHAIYIIRIIIAINPKKYRISEDSLGYTYPHWNIRIPISAPQNDQLWGAWVRWKLMVGEKTALWKDIIEKNKREMEEIYLFFFMDEKGGGEWSNDES